MSAWFRTLHGWSDKQQGVRDHCHAFLHALLSTTRQHLEAIANNEAVAQKIRNPEDRLPILASEFRDKMAKGRTFDSHGAYRENFYDIIFKRARKVTLPLSPRIELLIVCFRMRQPFPLNQSAASLPKLP